MEMFCFGIFAGMILAVIFIAGGALYARNTEKSNDVDSDCRIYVPCRDRDRSGNNGCDQSVEEVIDVLNTMSVGASEKEKAALDYSKECIDIAHKLAKYFKGETNE